MVFWSPKPALRALLGGFRALPEVAVERSTFRARLRGVGPACRRGDDSFFRAVRRGANVHAVNVRQREGWLAESARRTARAGPSALKYVSGRITLNNPPK